MFVVIGTLLLVTALYLIGKRQYIFSENLQVYAVFHNVNGLQLGNNVRYSGINIGTVRKIEMIRDGEIVILMMVEEKTGAFIRKDAIATIGSDGLVGSMVINIIPGKENAETIVSGDTIASYSRIGADDMLSTLNVTNENAAMLTSDLLKVTQSLIKGKGTLGKLLNDTLMASDLQQTVANLKQTSKQANTAISELNRMIGSVDFAKSAAGVLMADTVSS